MGKPQQPEVRRSEVADTDVAPIHVEVDPTVDSPDGPIPVDNVPGHHPDHEQDKPSAEDFVAKVKAKSRTAEQADEQERPATSATVPARSKASIPPKAVKPEETVAPTQTGAPTSTEPVISVTPSSAPPLSSTPPSQPAPPLVKLASGLIAAPIRITAEVIKVIRKSL